MLGQVFINIIPVCIGTDIGYILICKIDTVIYIVIAEFLGLTGTGRKNQFTVCYCYVIYIVYRIKIDIGIESAGTKNNTYTNNAYKKCPLATDNNSS